MDMNVNVKKNRVISQAIHKQKNFENLKNDLLPITWHPHRVYDWCFDEEEKGFLEGIWRVADYRVASRKR